MQCLSFSYLFTSTPEQTNITQKTRKRQLILNNGITINHGYFPSLAVQRDGNLERHCLLSINSAFHHPDLFSESLSCPQYLIQPFMAKFRKEKRLQLEYVLNNFKNNGTPLQYSCLENPVDRGAWKAAVHGFAKSQIRLSDFTFHFHALEKEMAAHSSVLAWRIPGTGAPGGLPLWSHRQSDMTEATQQQQQQSFKVPVKLWML